MGSIWVQKSFQLHCLSDLELHLLLTCIAFLHCHLMLISKRTRNIEDFPGKIFDNPAGYVHRGLNEPKSQHEN